MRIGAAMQDITPPAGLRLSGFAARTEPATGAHDRLSARALVVDDTALVVVDVLGIDADTSARIRQRCCLPTARVVVAALHTHGGPDAMPGRIGIDVDAPFLAALEAGCVAAVDAASDARREGYLMCGQGAAPGVARNRRHAGGTVDEQVPVLRFHASVDDSVIAMLIDYACHPVVLGADNRLYTADYPHFIRASVERAHPGCVALFATGAAADANSGHSAQDSLTLAAAPTRTFAQAARIGERVARVALDAPLQRSRSTSVGIADAEVELSLARREPAPLAVQVAAWRATRDGADATVRTLLDHWIRWAEEVALPDSSMGPIAGPVCRVSLLRWGDAALACLPGEIFAATAHELRARLDEPACIVVGYADDNPGYLPPAAEFAHGGYEVDEAHRYYRLGATFADDSVDRLLDRLHLLAAAGPDARQRH